MESYGIQPELGMEFGIYTLGDHISNPHTGKRIPAGQRIKEIIELAKLAEQAGIDFFSVGGKPSRIFHYPGAFSSSGGNSPSYRKD